MRTLADFVDRILSHDLPPGVSVEVSAPLKPDGYDVGEDGIRYQRFAPVGTTTLRITAPSPLFQS